MSQALASKWNILQVYSVVVFVVLANQEPVVCISYMYIHHMHRIYVVLSIFHVLVLDQIVYDGSYYTLWHHVVLCADEKMKWWKLACITKYFYIFVRNISNLLHRIPPLYQIMFTCTSFYLPWSITRFLCDAKYRSFLKLYGQTNIKGHCS